MSGQISLGDIVATVALLLSLYATVTTARFNNRQKSMIDSQERLNERLLQREDENVAASRKADLGANFVKYGSKETRLKIFNKGSAPARNVTISFPEGNQVLIQSDIDSKFPLEVLEPMQGVELVAALFLGERSKHPITLTWDDDEGSGKSKTVYPTT